MEIKEVNRNIPEDRENSNERFRVRYKDKSKFDLLVVNICRIKTNEIQAFSFKSSDLPDKDSIHFSTSINNGKFQVDWKGISSSPKTKKKIIDKVPEKKKPVTETNTVQIESFKPIVGKNPKVLILGTMPGKDSLRLNEYYANSRNVFWKIIYELHNSEIQYDYESKTEFLKQNGISIWDVCHKANRESSLDSDIKNEVPNELNDFLKANPSIKIIAFNGQKAEKLYDKYFERFDGINYMTLLSTSPANASYSFQEKIDNWNKIIKPSS
ncbi:DNA-deoxyinosine glycosylase [Candidatus Sulfidibacterium hydrothermale]|uniref:DNA-deoxyinosine glycosylase n=1 Tax=Candidatus Sulfidibacterium hydrothermale TaxID=2875962 RepID=UPI001F0AC76D|nr:DNA-deoxyinosine glycosylase [Candidatus Sulfidibacterium hydrothermale]UBM61554.1 DNA-deoxyinosine glycosylase [Candidatus Sulfidibacterium hydrothermale]